MYRHQLYLLRHNSTVTAPKKTAKKNKPISVARIGVTTGCAVSTGRGEIGAEVGCASACAAGVADGCAVAVGGGSVSVAVGCGVVVGATMLGMLAAPARDSIVGVADARNAGALRDNAVAGRLGEVVGVGVSEFSAPSLGVWVGARAGAGGSAGSGAAVGAVNSFSGARVGVGCFDRSSACPGASAIEVG
jgi:hypothetical protein